MRTLGTLVLACCTVSADWVSETTRSGEAYFVARDEAAWAAAWRRHDPDGSAPQVDFSASIVVGFAGEWTLERWELGTRFGESEPVLTVRLERARAPRFHAWLVPPTGVAVEFCQPFRYGIAVVGRVAPAEVHPPAVKEVPAELLAPLLRNLGDDDLAVREEATRRIIGFGRGAVPELRKRANDPDPEIRSRSQEIVHALEHQASRPEDLFAGRRPGEWCEEFELTDGVWHWSFRDGDGGSEPVSFDARAWIFTSRPVGPPPEAEK